MEGPVTHLDDQACHRTAPRAVRTQGVVNMCCAARSDMIVLEEHTVA